MLKNEKLLLFLLAMVQFSHIIDFMIIMPLGKQCMEFYDISPRQFSFLVSSYALSAFVAGLASSLYIDRFDRKKVLLLMYAGFTIGTLACAIAPSYGIFLAARALTGMFGGTLSALVLAIVGDVIPFERRGQAFGIVMMAFSVASVVGVPAGIFIAAEYGTRSPFLVIGCISILFFFIAWKVIPAIKGHLMEDEKGNAEHFSPKQVIMMLMNSPNQQLALLFSLTLMLGHFTIIPFIAPYYQINIGFSEGEIATMYAIGGTLTAICLPMVGRLADRYGLALVYTIASVVAIFSIYAFTSYSGSSVVLGLVISSSYFVVASGRSVPATAMVTSVVKPENRGSFMAMRQSVNQLGLFLSSFIGGLIVIQREDGSLGNYDYVGYFAIVMSVIAVFLARRLKAVG